MVVTMEEYLSREEEVIAQNWKKKKKKKEESQKPKTRQKLQPTLDKQ